MVKLYMMENDLLLPQCGVIIRKYNDEDAPIPDILNQEMWIAWIKHEFFTLRQDISEELGEPYENDFHFRISLHFNVDKLDGDGRGTIRTKELFPISGKVKKEGMVEI